MTKIHRRKRWQVKLDAAFMDILPWSAISIINCVVVQRRSLVKKSVKGPKSHRLSRAMAGRDDWDIKRTGKLVRTEDSEKNLRQWLWTKGGTRRKGWGRGILSFTFSSTPHLPWRLPRRLPKGDLTITDKQMKATLTLIILKKLLKANEPLTQFFFKRGTYVCNLHPYLPLGERRSSPSLHKGSISPSPTELTHFTVELLKRCSVFSQSAAINCYLGNQKYQRP